MRIRHNFGITITLQYLKLYSDMYCNIYEKKIPSFFISLKIDFYAKYCGHIIDDGPTSKIGHPRRQAILFV